MCGNKLLCIIRNLLIVLVLVSALGGVIIATVAIVCPNNLYGMQNNQTLKSANYGRFSSQSTWYAHSTLNTQTHQNLFIES